MILVNTLNDQFFTVNDIPKVKIYQMVPGKAVNTVSLVSVYNYRDVLFKDQPVNEIEIDGVVYANTLQTIQGFQPLTGNFNRAGEAAQNQLILRRGFASFDANPIGESHFEVHLDEPLTDYADALLHVFISPRNAAAASRAYYITPISKASSFDVLFTGNITDSVEFDWMIVLGEVPEELPGEE